jgi:protein-S-isoprenylcysteine O-methyltransferase Ste14
MRGEMGEVQGQGDEPRWHKRRRCIHVMLGIPLFGVVLLFLPAGTFVWGRGWGFLLVCWIMEMRALGYLERTNPALLTARRHLVYPGTKRWDKVLLSILLPVVLTIFPLAAMDNQRCQWSAVPWRLSACGYVLLLFGFWLSTWAGRVNAFAEPSVRIQTERGQTVMTTGPYAMIRHPISTASIGLFFGTALALGSYWALLPASVASGLLILRTQWEDQTLQAELDGYRAYIHQVPSKLILHVW